MRLDLGGRVFIKNIHCVSPKGPIYLYVTDTRQASVTRTLNSEESCGRIYSAIAEIGRIRGPLSADSVQPWSSATMFLEVNHWEVPV